MAPVQCDAVILREEEKGIKGLCFCCTFVDKIPEHIFFLHGWIARVIAL